MLSNLRSAQPLPLARFDLDPKRRRAHKTPGYLGHLKAHFEDVQAVDTDSGQRVSLTYAVSGRLYRDGEDLRIAHTSVRPVDAKDEAVDWSYRYRPGLRNTVGMAQAIAERLHQEYPSARSLEVEGNRMTDGFTGKRDQRIRLSLGDR